MISESHLPFNPIDPNIPLSPAKRKRETQTDDYVKKMRVIPFEWNELIDDIQFKILSLLSFKDLLMFDSTAKSSEKLTHKRWNQLLIEERFDFHWS